MTAAAWSDKPLSVSPALQTRFRRFVSQGPRIILGTASSPRRQIMDDLALEYPGLTYTVKKADIDERSIRSDEPHDLVLALGRAKRDAILAQLHAERASCNSGNDEAWGAGPGNAGGPFLITCDQVVVHNGRILEKPESAEQCREFIRGYGLDAASTVGSVVCTDVSTGTSYEGVDVSSIVFRQFPEHVIDKLVEGGECMHCAGGLMSEHPLVAPYIERIDGTEDGIRGLCKALVLTLLLEAAQAN